MFIPLKDLNPRRTYPVVNTLLILINIIVFLYEITLPPHAQQAFIAANATVPAHISRFLAGGHVSAQTVFLPLITSMFLHMGFAHIAGNMLFLWIFGDNVEDYFGHAGYLLFYFTCGIGADVAHIIFNLHSPVPALGASGAISGVMGAYIILFPRARVLTLVFLFFVPIPAFIILGYWFLLQFLAGVTSVGTAATGGTAWWAHIGGFLLGMFITFLTMGGRRTAEASY